MLEIALTSILHSTDQRAATRDIRYSARAEQTFTRECYSGSPSRLQFQQRGRCPKP